MNYQRVLCAVSTLGPIGYAKAPGTIATLIAFPIVLVLKANVSPIFYGIILGSVIIASYGIIQESLRFFDHRDPHEIVLDECIGCLITLFFIPITPLFVGLSFVLFRFFDIVKCFGIKQCESLAGAYGIMLDDMVAGLFAGSFTILILLGYQWILS